MPRAGLVQWLCEPAPALPGEQIIAVDSSGGMRWRQCLASARRWQAALDELPAQATLINLFETDGVAFLAALLAIWRSGRTAVIPANNLPATEAELGARSPWFIGGFSECANIIEPARDDPGELPAARVAPERQALMLFTSGSSGAPVQVAKSFAQIERELTNLEATWGRGLGRQPVLATVSHQHIYGLYFRLLWPLTRGQAFTRHSLAYWEQVASAAERWPGSVLVTSPAHLTRIPPGITPRGLARIFSSGAPLPAAVAAEASLALGTDITEVYGSTETGGIAWKTHGEQAWQLFPGVTAQLETSPGDEEHPTLRVAGAHLPAGVAHDTADRARLLSDGRLMLLGRADRLAKVGGKRVSLTRMEQALLNDCLVAEARVLPHPDQPERLAAVVALTPDGHAVLGNCGKNALNQRLRNVLADTVEGVALPRAWRYVERLPRNSQGKIVLAGLNLLIRKRE